MSGARSQATGKLTPERRRPGNAESPVRIEFRHSVINAVGPANVRTLEVRWAIERNAFLSRPAQPHVRPGVRLRESPVPERNTTVAGSIVLPRSAKEFEFVREKRLSEQDWREVKAMFEGATILETLTSPQRPHAAWSASD